MTPVCGLSANNIFKLMTEKDVPIDPTSIEYLENTSFAEHVNTLDSHKNYVVIVNDGRLGHKFLIDLPALTQGLARHISFSLISAVEHCRQSG